MLIGKPVAGERAWNALMPRFNAFLACLRPSLDTVRSAWARVAAMENLFKHQYWRRSAMPAKAILMTGGFGKDTALRGDRRVDALLILPQPADVGWATERRGSPAGSTVCDLLALFSQRYGAVRQIRNGVMEVRLNADPGGGELMVRLTPAYPRAGGDYLIRGLTGRANRSHWQACDPHAERTAVDLADQLGYGKARDLIRMLKAWRRSAAVPISPLALELLACHFIASWLYQRRGILFYDWMLRDYFFWMTAHANALIPIPGSDHRLNVGDAWLAHAQDAYRHATEASALERDNCVSEATDHWRAIFGYTFPAPAAREADRIADSSHRIERAVLQQSW